jgi:hypothetical protein
MSKVGIIWRNKNTLNDNLHTQNDTLMLTDISG